MSEETRPNPGEYQFLVDATADRMSPSARKRLHESALLAAERKIRLAGILIFVVFIVGCLGGIGSKVVAFLGLPHYAMHIINGLWGGCLFFGLYLLSKPTERIIRNYLAKELYKECIRPHCCLKCDYRLKGIQSNSCPECGAKLARIEDQVEYPSEDEKPIE